MLIFICILIYVKNYKYNFNDLKKIVVSFDTHINARARTIFIENYFNLFE